MKTWEPVPRGRKVKPDGLTLYPVERLGNQLFAYAAAFAQARRLSVPCYVNKAYYDFVHPARSFKYAYELDIFDSGLIEPPEHAYHLPVFLGYPARSARFWHNRVPSFAPGRGKSIFMEQSYGYDRRLHDVGPGTTLIGYFQSWRYFDDQGAEIRARMSQLIKPSDWYQEMSEKISPGSGAMALHVRRGDYLRPVQREFHGLVGSAYYEQALSYLRQMDFRGPVYISTDSPDLVSKEFAGMGKFSWINPPPGTNPFEVVLLLSRADGLVTANSSFSWWAGYIGERSGRVVIAPRPWFSDSHEEMRSRDLLPPHWLTLDRSGHA
jgi:Glycosyl transferase family 11